MLEHVDVAALAGDPAAYVDAVVRATALAFEDRDRHLCDPAFGEIPLDRLLDPAYLAERAGALARDAAPAPALAAPRPAGDTTFSCAVDADGNAAAVIQSIYQEWGSGVVAGDTGVLLQNRGCFFSLDPEHPNCLAPGKRTAHTLTAAMLIGERGPELVYGAMGGEGQPQTQAALATRVVDHGLSVQEAVDAPRWLLGRTWGEEHRGLRLEARFGEGVVRELAARGHENVSLVDDWSDVMGHAQAIAVFPDHLEAAADPRGDGAALGL
jgi:gamma-glutamyltranspeptidase/glutathione hydrolase